MSFFGRLANLFSRGGRDDSLLLQGLEQAKAKHPAAAIEIYNSLLDSSSTGSEVRARALFNRALAYSSLNQDEKAVADLRLVAEMPAVPDNVRAAARMQLARVQRRSG